MLMQRHEQVHGLNKPVVTSLSVELFTQGIVNIEVSQCTYPSCLLPQPTTDGWMIFYELLVDIVMWIASSHKSFDITKR